MIPLPQPVAAFFAAKTPSDIAATFTEDATVIDERRLRHGRDEIVAWRQEVAAISFTLDILSVAEADGKVTVSCRVSGSFPGSPIDLDHVFTLSGDRIERLEIG